jgi:hypothetical protein
VNNVLDQLLDVMPHVGSVGSIIRTPKGFEVRIASNDGTTRNLDVRHIEISEEHRVEDTVFNRSKEFPTGWYQNDKAELFHYEGSGYWSEVGLTKSVHLSALVINGKLEYLG